MTEIVTSLETIRQTEPDFIAICEEIVRKRWDRFKKIPNRQGSHPLLRDRDVDYMTSWDGRCFSLSQLNVLGEFVLGLIGSAMRTTDGLTVAWLATPVNGRLHYSLQLIVGTPEELPKGLLMPYLVDTHATA